MPPRMVEAFVLEGQQARLTGPERVQQIEGRPARTFQRVIIPPRLVVRHSCGGKA